MSTFKNVGFTSQSDWNAEPETSTKAPKSLVGQVAATSKGRAMQAHAETVRDQVDELTEREFENIEAPDKELRDVIASYFESKHLDMDRETGKFKVNPETDKATLKAIKENLLDVRLDLTSENRETMRGLIGKVDEAIAQREIAELPQTIAKALKDLGEAQARVRSAIDKKEYDALPALNEKMLVSAFAILDGLEKMRASNPDKMIEMLDILRSSEGPIYTYKTTLIEFAKTHNTFRFSEDTVESLSYKAKKDERYAAKRNFKPSFAQALLEAYQAPKSQDDPYTFLQRVTRIPENRFRQIVERALRS